MNISKRYSGTQISKRAAWFNALGDLLEVAASSAGLLAKEMGANTAVAGHGAEALGEVEKISAIEAKTVLRRLYSSSRVEASARKILQIGRDIGYTETTIDKLLTTFYTDFSKMSRELEALPPNPPGPSAAELSTFYENNKHCLDFFKELRTNAELKQAMTAGLKAGEDGSVRDPLVAAKWGKVLGKMLIPAGTIGAGAWGVSYLKEKGVAKGVASILGVVQSPSTEDVIKVAKGAIECLDDIKASAGTEVSTAQRVVRENLIKFIALEDAAKTSDATALLKTIKESDTTGEILCSDAQTPGSLQNFIAMVSENPSQLDGFTDRIVADVAGGGAFGAGLALGVGALWWVALLGGIVASAAGGWYFVSKRYDSQLQCLGHCVESIKSFEEMIRKIGETKDNAPQAMKSDGLASTTDQPKLSLLAKIISVMQNNKLGGIPGLELVNEIRMAQAIVGGTGNPENAATVLSGMNSNIAAYLKSVVGDENTPIEEPFVKANKGLIDTIYTTMHTIFKNALVGKNIFDRKPDTLAKYVKDYLATIGYENKTADKKINKMKKESKPTNNDTLLRKAAETKVSYFTDANLGLKEQLTKAYYAGLSGMYNETPQKRNSDYKDYYGIPSENKAHIVLQSHPKSITLADAMGKGGLVENGLEQKEQSTYVTTKTPSGNFQSKYASTLNYLQKLSDVAEKQNKKEVSDLIKQTLKNLK